jgi:hypothetical protein
MKLLQFAALRLAPVVVLLMLTVRSHAQAPILSISDITAEPGTSIEVDVSVQNYVMILGAQFSIKWDSSKLEYTGLSDIALEATEEENFNRMFTENGKLAYLFLDPTQQGATLEDGTPLFQIHFNVLGTDGEQTTVEFSDSPTGQEISDTSFMALPVTYENGTVNIGQTSATRTDGVLDFAVQIAPNPFAEMTRISWSNPNREPVRIAILNTAGQLVRQFEHPRGADPAFTLRAKDLPASGTYIIELHTKNGKTTHKVAFVKPR